MELERIGNVCVREDGYCIDIDPPFRAALAGLGDFGHALVLFWFHELDDPRPRSSLRIEAPYRSGPASLGSFATRAPLRPNPIGLTTVALLEVDEAAGRIRTPFIDALDRSPVLDIKPYVPALDRVRDFEPPAWCAHWPQWAEDAAVFDWAGEVNSTPQAD